MPAADNKNNFGRYIHMAGKIIPRWEWRTFLGENGSFGESEAKIKTYEMGNFKKSAEQYILSANSNENCKVRDELMDIKSPVAVNEDKLEQWYPTLKEGFPLSQETITKLCTEFFKVEVPAMTEEGYDFAAYIELCKSIEGLVVVDVYKERSIFVINDAVVEIAEVKFNGVPMRTICVEHADPENVIGVVRMLGLENYPNVNYIQAMKKAVGLL